MELYNNLTEKMDSLKSDAEKFFEKGNNAAGTRLRKGLQEIKKLSSELRKAVSAAKGEKKVETTE